MKPPDETEGEGTRCNLLEAPLPGACLGGLVRSYRLCQRMMRYPRLMGEIRALFVAALTEKGVTTREALRSEALAVLQDLGRTAEEESVAEFANALTDLSFACHFNEEEAEQIINLARKKEAFQNLAKVLNTEEVSPQEIVRALKEFCAIPQGNVLMAPSEAEGVRVSLINTFISSQLPFLGVSKNYIAIRDIDEILDHSFWSRRRSGKIGGKAAGMFLAYKIVLPRLSEKDPELERSIVIPESYYFTSGILSDFIDYNQLYSFHTQKYKSREVIEEEYSQMGPVLEKASFPPDVMESFQAFLQGIGEHPLILRSSSLLEDSFSHSFSGKYDSVFMANRGELPTRLKEFVRCMKQVLMSTFNPGAILYRRDHNLLDFDERMSVLVQKVVGRRFGNTFFPFAAGVAFSRNTHAWTSRIQKEDGLVRLVLGLGTRAVDRIAPDYPRIIALSHPSLRPEVGAAAVRKYSQKLVEVLNLETGHLETLPYLDLFRRFEHPDLFHALSLEEGGYFSAPLFPGQKIDLHGSCITFDNFLLKTPFVRLMRKVLSQLEKAYGRPVEVEFAWDEGKLYLLQCRSLATQGFVGKVALPLDIPEDQVLFSNNRGVSNGVVRNIRYLVYVDPKAYGRLAGAQERMAVGRVVGRINRILEGKRYALLGPSRWGSNDIQYGVKVGYEDINGTRILGEVAFEEKGLTPEVSSGTHFFNDLVEARIVPVAIYPDEPGVVFREEFLLQSPNSLGELAPDLAPYESVVHVVDLPACTAGRFLQVFQDGQDQQGIAFLAPPDEEPRSSED